MSWLAALDARSDRWPTVGRWLYRGLKWYLIALGGFALVRVLLDRMGLWPFY